MKRGSKGKGRRGRRRRTPTKGDRPHEVLGPRRLHGEDAVREAERARQRQEDELAARRRRDLAKAAIELDPVDVLILQHQVLRPWLTQEQIGDLVGLGRQAVNERINAPKFQRAIAEAGRSALEIFQSNQSRAARKLGKLIDDPDSRVAIRAAIAHMWPHIHADSNAKTGDDFVKFLQEAFDKAEADKVAAGGEDKSHA
jgi:hypothetical protein